MQDQWNIFYGVKVREKQSLFFSAPKIVNLARAGTESLWHKVWTTQNYAEFFALLTRAVQTLPSGFFRGWRRVMACSLFHYTNSKISDILFHYSSSPDFLITRLLDAVISWFTNIRLLSEVFYTPQIIIRCIEQLVKAQNSLIACLENSCE